jgi:hypothetical protein
LCQPHSSQTGRSDNALLKQQWQQQQQAQKQEKVPLNAGPSGTCATPCWHMLLLLVVVTLQLLLLLQL